MTRRDFIQKYGIYGTTLPMSISILFQPSFSHAACSDAGTPCTFNWDCCSGKCRNNGTCRKGDSEQYGSNQEPDPETCLPKRSPCTFSFECCSGKCRKNGKCK